MAESNTSAFSRVLSAFRSRLSPQDINDFEVTTFADLKLAIADIQRQQVQRRGLRNLNKIRPFLNSLGQYAQVIEVFVSAKPVFLAFIWGPIKFCLQVASKLSEAFDALLDAYEKIEKSFPIFSMIDHLFASNAHVQQVLVDVYEDILDFHKRAIVVFKQSVWRLAFKVTRHTFGDMFGDIIKKLERSKELLLQSANVAHFHEAQEARLLFSREIEVLEERAKKDRMLTVVNWLSPTSCSGDHEELQGKRREFPDTARWILREPSMRDWLRLGDDAKPMFWICGIPGAGKTVLFSSIVDEIRVTIPDSQVIYFYCKNRDPSKRSFDNIARSLIAQLFHLNPISLDYLHALAAESGERHPNNSKVYRDILENISISHNRLFIGIDGLDECEEVERGLILSLMGHVLKVSSSQANVKVILTSQRVKDIQESLKSAIRFDIKHHHVKQDIQSYVRTRSLQLCKKFGYGPEKQKALTMEISSRPNGMFLLARLIMDNLLNQDSIEDLEEELCSDTLPNGIDEAYGRIIVRLRKGRTEKTLQRIKRVLEIILTARRPLKINELQGALSIRIQDRNVDFMRRRSMTPFNELCGPLIEAHADDVVSLVHPTAKQYLVQHHSGPYIDNFAAELSMANLCTSYLTFDLFENSLPKVVLQQKVTIGSFAFQEYATLNWLYHITCLSRENKEVDNGELSSLREACRILESRHGGSSSCSANPPSSYDRRPHSSNSRADFDQLQARYEVVISITDGEESSGDSTPYLLQIIARVRSIIEDLSPTGGDNAISLTDAYGTCLFKCSILACPRFLQGFTTRKLRDEHQQTHRSRFKCTHEGCDYSVLGFINTKELAKHLAEHDSQLLEVTFPKVQRFSLNNALEYAIDRDDFLSARKLSIEISALPNRNTSFLLRAAKKMNLEAFKALIPALATDKDINFHDKLGWGVLHYSAHNGSEEMVKLVLEMGADVNAKTKKKDRIVTWRGETPLMIAASRGHSHIVKLILGQSNRVSDLEKYCKTPLQLAADGGHIEAMQTILDTDGAIYAQNKAYMKAITSAASKRHESAVRLLLERGHELGAEKIYSKALQHLLPKGIEATVAQAMQSVDANGKTKGNALQSAALKGNSSEVIRLLREGADINHSSGLYGTALVAAAKHGDPTLVQLLLDNGANINAQSGTYGTALQLAIRSSQEAVVSLLLKHDPEIDLNHPVAGTALHEAASTGNEAIVSLLLIHGPEIDLNHSYLGTALHQAVSKGNEAIVGLLLKHGPEINLNHSYLGTALHVAVHKGNEATVGLLLECKANVNAIGNFFGNKYGITPCQLAAEMDHEAIMRLLLQHGADVNAGYGESALQRAKHSGHKGIVKLLCENGAKLKEEGTFDMGYASLEQDDILENFDFDAFLQSTEDGFNFDPPTLATENESPIQTEEEDVQPQTSPGST